MNSDAESEPDAYLARMKAEAEEESDEGEGDDESEEDEDFAPEDEKAASDVAEEYVTNNLHTCKVFQIWSMTPLCNWHSIFPYCGMFLPKVGFRLV